MARPINYDEEAVVAAALEQFWSDGFRHSSVDTLVAGTGLNRHSLYGAFGGKHGLFVRVLERYLAEYALVHLRVFDELQGLAALRKYFDGVLHKPASRGCLVVNTAVEIGHADPDCQRLISNYYRRLADCFAKAIQEGQQAGDIRAELDAKDTAAWLVTALQGAAVRARLGAGRLPPITSLLNLLANPGA